MVPSLLECPVFCLGCSKTFTLFHVSVKFICLQMTVTCPLQVLWWLTARHSGYAWLLQDFFAVFICCQFLLALRMSSIKVSTVLLVSFMVYDIFMVFLSPLIFKSSVMVTVCYSCLLQSAKQAKVQTLAWHWWQGMGRTLGSGPACLTRLPRFGVCLSDVKLSYRQERVPTTFPWYKIAPTMLNLGKVHNGAKYTIGINSFHRSSAWMIIHCGGPNFYCAEKTPSFQQDTAGCPTTQEHYDLSSMDKINAVAHTMWLKISVPLLHSVLWSQWGYGIFWGLAIHVTLRVNKHCAWQCTVVVCCCVDLGGDGCSRFNREEREELTIKQVQQSNANEAMHSTF